MMGGGPLWESFGDAIDGGATAGEKPDKTASRSSGERTELLRKFQSILSRV
jgi:hypothetical protein